MPAPDVHCYYLKTNAPGHKPLRYPSLDEAMSAMSDLIQLHRGRGFRLRRHPDGKRTLAHLDGTFVRVWVEDEHANVVS
jgi:hypothetical protein